MLRTNKWHAKPSQVCHTDHCMSLSAYVTVEGGGDRGSQPPTSHTMLSHLPYFYAPLPPDSHPPLNNSYIQVNKKDHKPDQFSLWQHSTRLSLIAGEFGLLQLARHLQIHSWPITYPNSIGIQFHQYYAVFFSLRKKLHFLAYKILFYASVDIKWE